jgi:hypothetical protein
MVRPSPLLCPFETAINNPNLGLDALTAHASPVTMQSRNGTKNRHFLDDSRPTKGARRRFLLFDF